MGDNWLPMPRYKLRKDLVSRILSREPLHGKTCLEIGYGAGDMLLLYAELGLDVHGYDISEQAFDYAGRRVEEHCRSGRISLLRNETDLTGSRFDYIMAFEVLEHIEDDSSCLKNWWNMLKDGGRLLISVPAHTRKWGASDIAAGHYRRYEKEGVRNLLIRSGFNVLELWNYAYPLSILLDIFLHKQYRASGNSLSKEDLSKESGIKRKKNLFNKIVSSDLFLSPFLLLQQFFLEEDLSSAYLIFAEKVPDHGRVEI